MVNKVAKYEDITDVQLANELKNNGYNDVSVKKSGNKFKVTFSSGNVYTIKDDGTVEKYEKTEPTAVYAKLYTDGTLILSSADYTDSTRTIAENGDYGDVSQKVNYYSESVNGTPSLKGDYPGWLNGAAIYYPGGNSKIKKLIIKDKIVPINTSYWFCGSAITEIDGLEKMDTSNITDMSSMFAFCQGLSNLNLSNFDTSNVTNMSRMLYCCSGIETLNVSSFDTSKVTDMNYMFASNGSLTQIIGIEQFNTSNVTNMEVMLGGTSLTSLSISNFDTTKVTNMRGMFSGNMKLNNLDLSNFDTRNVEDMSAMFSQCENLKNVNLSSFDTSKVTQMYSMFGYCKNLENLNLKNFNTSKVTQMNGMFDYVTAPIIVGENWNSAMTESATGYNGTFEVENN